MVQIIEEYGMMVVEALGYAVTLGVIAWFVQLLVEHGSALLDLAF